QCLIRGDRRNGIGLLPLPRLVESDDIAPETEPHGASEMGVCRPETPAGSRRYMVTKGGVVEASPGSWGDRVTGVRLQMRGRAAPGAYPARPKPTGHRNEAMPGRVGSSQAGEGASRAGKAAQPRISSTAAPRRAVIAGGLLAEGTRD